MKAGPPKKAPRGASVRNEVRIIGGRWRGRRIQFPDAEGLRPTPDRVRETLFNWLQGAIPQSRCLDVFAGSGAMGFEAASRGASSVTLIEQDSRTCRQLRLTADTLQARNVKVECSDALAWLRRQGEQCFEVVFLDPPFARNLLADACALLESQRHLAPGAYIYMEAPADQDLALLPAGWVVMRSKRAGQVGYHLARSQAPVAP